MRTKDYITAVTDLLKEGKDLDTTLASLKSHLGDRGRTKLYPRILRGLLRKSEHEETRKGVKVIVARESDAKKYAAAIETRLAELGVTAYSTEIDDTLIGGFIVRTKDTQIDQSFKHTLLHAYRALIG